LQIQNYGLRRPLEFSGIRTAIPYKSHENFKLTGVRLVKNNPVKKMVNYWQLWLPLYRKNTVCYCFTVLKLTAKYRIVSYSIKL